MLDTYKVEYGWDHTGWLNKYTTFSEEDAMQKAYNLLSELNRDYEPEFKVRILKIVTTTIKTLE